MTTNGPPSSAAAALALLCCVGCDGSASVPRPSASADATLASPRVLGPSVSEVPSDARTTAPTTEEAPNACPPFVRVAPGVLARDWLRRVGQRVRFGCRVIAVLDFTTSVIRADGATFAVTAEPGSDLCTSTSTFIVLGSTRVHDHGRVRLPELLLDDCGR